MTTTMGYACIDGYAGDALTKHLERLISSAKK